MDKLITSERQKQIKKYALRTFWISLAMDMLMRVLFYNEIVLHIRGTFLNPLDYLVMIYIIVLFYQLFKHIKTRSEDSYLKIKGAIGSIAPILVVTYGYQLPSIYNYLLEILPKFWRLLLLPLVPTSIISETKFSRIFLVAFGVIKLLSFTLFMCIEWAVNSLKQTRLLRQAHKK